MSAWIMYSLPLANLCEVDVYFKFTAPASAGKDKRRLDALVPQSSEA